jgi:Domain of unknown function (DUF3576)
MFTRMVAIGLVVGSLLAGCGSSGGKGDASSQPQGGDQSYKYATTGTDYNNLLLDRRDNDFNLLGSIFGNNSNNSKKNDATGEGGGGRAGTGVGVNSYLWRATLDTVSFMPLASADPFGGVIITDWYSPAEAPDERFKVDIFILGRELRADGLRATVFRQKRDVSGQWSDAPVDQGTGVDIENAILMRARQIRLSAASK